MVQPSTVVLTQQAGVGPSKQLLSVLEGARWHRSDKVVVPEGIHLERLSPYLPELQPAERLWQIADEPLVNTSFDTIGEPEAVLAEHCVTLLSMTDKIRALTNYQWWS